MFQSLDLKEPYDARFTRGSKMENTAVETGDYTGPLKCCASEILNNQIIF